MAISIGETVGDYRILEEIGRGGMGRVFKVEHAVTRRVEAMKVLAGGFDASPQAARSLREIQLQASLDHPNIAAVHNAFWAGEDLVLVMELIEGRSLRRVLEDGRVPLATTLDWAGQALSALSYAHEHGVIHRDISPANIMISSDGCLKLTDFGLAKGPADARLSQTGAPLGSVWYMSPEQVRGSDSDARSDIYSLGAVLYELASGKKPFDGTSAFVIMADQVGKPPVPPMEVDPAVPPGLSAALLRALEKDPNRRFQTAGEFMACIQSPRSAGAGPRFRFARPWAIWIAAAILCLVAVLSGSHWWRSLANAPAVAQIQSPDPLAKANNLEPAEPASNPPSKPPKQTKAKRTKSSPNIFRKALRPIWPLSKHEKQNAADR